MKNYFLLVSIFWGLTSCNSSDEVNNEIDNQELGAWVSSACNNFAEILDGEPTLSHVKYEYAFTKDTVSVVYHHYDDGDCIDYAYTSVETTFPLERKGTILADTGETVQLLEWSFIGEGGNVIMTSLNSYVEGESLYLATINKVDGITSVTIDFDHPYVKQVNKI